MLGGIPLSRPKPPQAGPKASLYKGIAPSDNCRPRSVGRPLPLPQPLPVGSNRPARRAKFTHSKFKRPNNKGSVLDLNPVTKGVFEGLYKLVVKKKSKIFLVTSSLSREDVVL